MEKFACINYFEGMLLSFCYYCYCQHHFYNILTIKKKILVPGSSYNISVFFQKYHIQSYNFTARQLYTEI